jgi:hypothetical protein
MKSEKRPNGANRCFAGIGRLKGRSLSAMISGSKRVTLKEYQSPTELEAIFEQFLQTK